MNQPTEFVAAFVPIRFRSDSCWIAGYTGNLADEKGNRHTAIQGLKVVAALALRRY
ncbi:MAG: hypothetical protein R3D34_13100 [Nitratireductor sp.]